MTVLREYYELNPDNLNEVLFVQQLTNNLNNNIIKTHHGFSKRIQQVDMENGALFFHERINLDNGSYERDLDNKDPIIVNGVSLELNENGEVFIDEYAELDESVESTSIQKQINDIQEQVGGLSLKIDEIIKALQKK